jgi:hypothetical protein
MTDPSGYAKTLALPAGFDAPRLLRYDDVTAHAITRDDLGADVRGPPNTPKALLRILIQELRVNSRAEILPTYRIVTPMVCATTSSVELAGLEPATSWVRSRRSPN